MFLLLLLALVIVFFVLSSLNVGTNTATQTNSEGQCLSNGKGFNTPQEAFTLAQAAEQYRSANPYKGNYGLGSYTICYAEPRLLLAIWKGFGFHFRLDQDTDLSYSSGGFLIVSVELSC